MTPRSAFRFALAVASCLALLQSPAAAQPGWTLTVSGDAPRPYRVTPAELARLPHTTVRGTGDDGKEAAYSGVRLADLLRRAGVGLGTDMKRDGVATAVVIGAADGYRAVFALAELDPAFTDRLILLADGREGRPLGGNAGPLEVIVPSEKRQARWVRQVTSITIKKL